MMLRSIGSMGLAAALALLSGGARADAAGPYTVVATGQHFTALQEAVNALGEGDGVIRIAPGVYRDCAVQPHGNVSFVAEVSGKTVFDGKTCEGKGALVVRGKSTTIEGIIFQNMRLDEGNGAGIRLERGSLTVRQSWFRDSEEGILSSDDPDGRVLIEKSTFTRLGRCDRGLSCAHSAYFGEYANVTVRNCRFEAGRGGHYLKTRSARVEVTDSSFDDSAGRSTNYMIDLSTGSTGIIRGNWFIDGRDKENHTTFIANAAEGHHHSADGLTIADNVARLAPGADYSISFLTDWSGDGIRLGANTIGAGIRKFEKR